MAVFHPFEIIPGRNDASMVILADHATNLLPAEYGHLGLPATAFARHIAYDIGVEAMVRRLSERLGIPAVLSKFSRLLIDPNRGEDDPTLIMRISDGAVIPGNHPIEPAEREARLKRFYRPYHDAVAAVLGDVEARNGKAPLVFSIHSFTPIWRDFVRPWHAAVLWDSDPRVVVPLLAALREDRTLVFGDNEPYDGALKGDTMYRHCLQHGIPHALVEVRQDLIGDDAGVSAWVERLVPIFARLNMDPCLHERQIHPSRTGPYDQPTEF